MPQVVVIHHHHDDLDDLASTHLARNGYEIAHCYPFNGESPALDRDIAGTIVMGGAQNVSQMPELSYLQDECNWIEHCMAQQHPVVGICLGSQLLAHTLGARVQRDPAGRCEFGYATVSPTRHADHWLTQPIKVVQAHFEAFEIPDTAVALATGEDFPNQAFRVGEHAFGLQFHPEVTHAMFSRWQASDWSAEFRHTPGAQPVAEQTRDNNHCNDAQARWFCDFLDKLLPPL